MVDKVDLRRRDAEPVGHHIGNLAIDGHEPLGGSHARVTEPVDPAGLVVIGLVIDERHAREYGPNGGGMVHLPGRAVHDPHERRVVPIPQRRERIEPIVRPCQLSQVIDGGKGLNLVMGATLLRPERFSRRDHEPPFAVQRLQRGDQQPLDPTERQERR